MLTGLPAGAAVATVTGLLAAVEAAVELVATDLEALVFQNLEETAFIYTNNRCYPAAALPAVLPSINPHHAAQLATLVAAAGAFLAAALLASEHQLFCNDRAAE